MTGNRLFPAQGHAWEELRAEMDRLTGGDLRGEFIVCEWP